MKYISCPHCGSQNRETDETCYSCSRPLQGAPLTPLQGSSSIDSVAVVSSGAPPVLIWYKVFCVLLVLLYLVCIIFGAFLLTADLEALTPHAGVAVSELKAKGIVILIICIPLLLLYAMAPFMPRKPWSWIMGIVLMCLTMTSCCCVPFAIPLLIFWIRPECRDYFQE